MNTQYRYQLERGSKKYACPSCLKKRLVRFIDIENNQYLPEKYGKCDRSDNCGYSLNPYIDGYNTDQLKDWKPKIVLPQRKDSFIPHEVLKQTFQATEVSTFIHNLETNYSHEAIDEIISQYYLGAVTNGYRKGAITLPFIDINNHVRAIQVKQFDKNQNTTSTDFLHSMIDKFHQKKRTPLPDWLTEYKKNEKTVSCLFGEHLLNWYPNNPVALVEAPKTAIYGTLNFGFPERTENFLWLAVYNLSSLNYEKCKVLEGRKVILYPDTSEKGTAYKLWEEKAEYFNKVIPNSKFWVSKYLEKTATKEEKVQGFDLADYLNKKGLAA